MPRLRGKAVAAFAAAWGWAVWTLGVALRWFANIFTWHWRVLLPSPAALELSAFLIFFQAVSRHRPQGSSALDPWVWVVRSGTVGLLLLLAANLGGCPGLALHGSGLAFAHVF